MGGKVSALGKDTADDDVSAVKKSMLQNINFTFAKAKEMVIQKVLNNPIYGEKLKDDPETLQRFAHVLSTKDELKGTYLTTDWLETIKLYKTIQTETRKNTNKAGGMFASKVDSATPTEEDEVEDLEQTENDQEVKDFKLKNKIKIKLVISEVASSEARKNFRRFISPVLSKLDLLPEFGMFHSGLMIGPWMIEWNNSALCVPRKCVSKAALLTADIDSIDTSAKIDEVVDKLADVIVDWNTRMGYKDHGGDKQKEGNCQDFVQDVLHRLNIKPNFGGPMAEFLKTLREKGTADLFFPMDAEFREKFNISQKKMVFDTHEQLDQFVKDVLLKQDPEFDQNYKSAWAMLKSFDRALWLRHYKFAQDTKWIPLKVKTQDDDGDTCVELGCPFGDPQESYSIRFTNK